MRRRSSAIFPHSRPGRLRFGVSLLSSARPFLAWLDFRFPLLRFTSLHAAVASCANFIFVVLSQDISFREA